MKATRLIFLAIFLLGVLGAPLTTALADTQPATFEFPLARKNSTYTLSMEIVLLALGKGQGVWTLHPGKNSFNEQVGCLESTCGWNGQNYPVMYFDGVRTPAPGACDIASYLVKVADLYGLSWDRTAKHKRSLYGVEEKYWVSIWNPGQDAWIINPYTHDISLRWSVTGTTLKVWMEGLDGSVTQKPPSISLAAAIQSNPVDTSMEGSFILDPTAVPTSSPVFPQEKPGETQPLSGSMFLIITVAGLLVLGGVLLIASASEKSRGIATVIVFGIWLACLVIGLTSFKNGATPNVIPTPIPEVTFGTGGGQMEYVWSDPVIDNAVKQELISPPVVTNGSTLSKVFWYFAVGQLWGSDIPRWANAKNVDPDVVATFILVESGGNPYAHCPNDKLGYRGSSDDLRDHGLFQLNPAYFKNGCDLESNASQGVDYIASRLKAANGNLAAAAAGYNGGPMALKWFLTSTDSNSAEYQSARAEYISFLNNHGYNGLSKAAIVEVYVKRILGVYNAAKTNSTLGLEPFLSQGSYAGSVAKAYGISWPPVTP